MALLTLHAESSLVHVISRMATAADHGGLHLVLRTQVALGAAGFGVCPKKRKACSCRVIEIPVLPAIGVVARFALLSEGPTVGVVPGVTADARQRSVTEPLRGVTLGAGRRDMQANQRISRLIVVEADLSPLRGAVAPLTLLAESPAVGLIGTVAVNACCAELLLLRDAGVAGVTVQLRVSALEHEVEALRVIESAHLPDIISMAVGASRPEPARVPVIGSMAALTVPGNRVVQVSGAVAVRASDVRMTAQQREICLARVVEALRGPRCGAMAIAALSPLAALVNVIRGMARHALLRRPPVVLACMARRAGELAMPVGEGVRGVVVIERRA